MPRTSIFFITLAVLFLVQPIDAPAFDEKQLTDPAEQARVEKLMKQVGCALCQNQTIKVSDTPAAANLRKVVHDRVAAGDTNKQVMAYLKAHYSDQVIFEKTKKRRSKLLWLMPWILLKVALVLLVLKFGKDRFPILAKMETFRPINIFRRLMGRGKTKKKK